MDFKHCISFATDLAANFACNQLFPSFCALPSEVAVLFYCNMRILNTCPFLGQVFDLDLLLCTGFNSENADLFQCPFSTQRPINDRKIEQSKEQWALLWFAYKFSQTPSKISFHINSVVTAQNLQRIQTFFKLNQYCKSGGTFSSSDPVEASEDYHLLWNALICARPSDPQKLCQSAAPTWPPRARPLIFQSKLSISLWNSLLEWFPDDRQGLKLGLKNVILQSDHWVQDVKVWSDPIIPISLNAESQFQTIGIWYSTIWSMWRPAIINVLCLGALKTVAYMVSFFKQGGGPCSPVWVTLNSPITILYSWRGVFSNPQDIETSRYQKIEPSVRIVGLVFGQKQAMSRQIFHCYPLIQLHLLPAPRSKMRTMAPRVLVR